MQRCFVIHSFLDKDSNLDHQYKLQEVINLSKALDLEVSAFETIKIKEFNPAYLFKKGFLENLKLHVETLEIDVVIINYQISAIQQRNLERYLQTKVIDRNALIISIFAKRAKSKEGKIQAELANLYYQKSRLVKAWSHLERQRGGGGFTGGPGETQKELDKRMIADKIANLLRKLKKVKQNRNQQAASRKKNHLKTVALVGYTNAGKSTLFNTLTQSCVFAEDLLFATLDPKMKLLELKAKQKVIISDTVGFVSDLPHQLVEAFHSTLDEVKDADIILHIIDAKGSNYKDQKRAVIKVLEEIGIDEIEYNKKAIDIYNKSDLLSKEEFVFFTNYTNTKENSILISARDSNFLDKLRNIIFDKINSDSTRLKLSINYKYNELLVFLYKNAFILVKEEMEDFINLEIMASKYVMQNLNNRYKGYYEKIIF